MSEQEDFVSFEKALRDLEMQSEELKKLVSEGEIRAFRDGQSMKFRREDVAHLKTQAPAEDDLAFVDALEDDTGMVTEELSDEETLLAEDDLAEEPAAIIPVRRTSATARRRQEAEAPSQEPGWVTAVAVLGALVMLYGVMVLFSIAHMQPPSGLTAIFASS